MKKYNIIKTVLALMLTFVLCTSALFCASAEDKTEYTISYDLDGGALPDGKENPAAFTSEDTVIIESPEKEGYLFIGWTGTGLAEETVDLTIFEGSEGDREYKANWIPIEYDLRFDLDGGVWPESGEYPEFYTIEDLVTFDSPMKEGFAFVGWTGTELEEITFVLEIGSGAIGDREYLAHWTLAEYAIEYDLGGGAFPEDAEIPTGYNTESSSAIINPIREHYAFAGWTGTDLEEAVFELVIPVGSEGRREYKANWTPLEYRIVYDLDGGKWPDGVIGPGAYTVESSSAIPDPEKEDHVFIGWTGTELEAPAKGLVIPEGSSGIREYLANWELVIVEYSVTSGKDQTYVKKSNAPLNFTCDGSLEKFTGVKLDGEDLAAEFYSAVSGSTVLTLTSTCLDALDAGGHTLQFVYTNGVSDSVSFRVVNPAPVPQTGDDSDFSLWLVLGAICAAGMTAVIKKRED